MSDLNRANIENSGLTKIVIIMPAAKAREVLMTINKNLIRHGIWLLDLQVTAELAPFSRFSMV